MSLLANINDPADLRKLSIADLPPLAKEVRDFIIQIVATKEGHLGASLGVVELTLALHYCFDTPRDVLVWDVGHQAYGHKIITGRKNIFHTNRQLNGLSGFPRRSESIYDVFGTGHSSTSISAVLGMALANGLSGYKDILHIAVIGDASIASGMAFEALNHLGETDANVLVVLNDNAIGIDPSVGALKAFLGKVKEGSAQGNFLFDSLNLPYYGPVDGHDMVSLCSALKKQSKLKGPRLLHVVTTKGKGLPKAEQDQVTYHAPGQFDHSTGERLKKSVSASAKYQDVFGLTLVELGHQNENIIGITPAMPTGSSLKYFLETFPHRGFDVGIAEQHAVTFAAGMAIKGKTVFCNIYATFLQRAYDQIIHDVALQNIPVIFCIDRAGLVGQDGPTHHGVFDIAFLRCIPNMMIMSPRNERELRNMLYTAQLNPKQPIAIRYPRGYGVLEDWQHPFTKINWGRGVPLKKGSKIAVLTIGPMGNTVSEAILKTEDPTQFGHYDMRFVKPLDETLLHGLFEHYQQVVTLEDGCIKGGFGSAIAEFAQKEGYQKPITILGIPDAFILHGTPEELFEQLRLDVKGITATLNQLIESL